ncbi:hypothetical protein HHK36_019654 [Tetracentron sinense]|uniref:Uncharacterized protein n=1 Tax=Tetracentron sinense TaxID=13715 RepID=A0A835DCY7_TETSI|nr:hypothetical protein HHK36_019654 [Tetracentron sinense]
MTATPRQHHHDSLRLVASDHLKQCLYLLATFSKNSLPYLPRSSQINNKGKQSSTLISNQQLATGNLDLFHQR